MLRTIKYFNAAIKSATKSQYEFYAHVKIPMNNLNTRIYKWKC